MLVLIGAEGGDRTHTVRRPLDFESNFVLFATSFKTTISSQPIGFQKDTTLTKFNQLKPKIAGLNSSMDTIATPDIFNRLSAVFVDRRMAWLVGLLLPEDGREPGVRSASSL